MMHQRRTWQLTKLDSNCAASFPLKMDYKKCVELTDLYVIAHVDFKWDTAVSLYLSNRTVAAV